MKNNSKSLYEEFAVFFENPTRDSLRKLLSRNFGESNQIDFKESWPESNKLAKHILAFANSGGGVILNWGIRKEGWIPCCRRNIRD